MASGFRSGLPRLGTVAWEIDAHLGHGFDREVLTMSNPGPRRRVAHWAQQEFLPETLADLNR